jgi:transcriptional regulator with XRE-family HTH domain
MKKTNEQPNLTDSNTNSYKTATNEIDITIGMRLRSQRLMKGLSQEKLGDIVGLTFQQVQKYERGINRISASRLHFFAKALGVLPSYFFEGIEDNDYNSSLHEDESPSYDAAPMVNRETAELVRAYYQIEDLKVRKSVIDLLKNMAKSTNKIASDE